MYCRLSVTAHGLLVIDVLSELSSVKTVFSDGTHCALNVAAHCSALY